MKGPFRSGTRVKRESLGQHFLVRGKRYSVIKTFADADGDEHAVGEEWQFVGSTIGSYDSEVVFVVRTSTEDEWLLVLGDDTDRQHDVLAHIDEYIAPRSEK